MNLLRNLSTPSESMTGFCVNNIFSQYADVIVVQKSGMPHIVDAGHKDNWSIVQLLPDVRIRCKSLIFQKE